MAVVEKINMFLEVSETKNANIVDIGMYRLERFSDSKNTWVFIRRKNPISISPDKDNLENFLEVINLDLANTVDMSVYRFECFSETRSAYLFVKRRV
jgi:hypothetical protein